MSIADDLARATPRAAWLPSMTSEVSQHVAAWWPGVWQLWWGRAAGASVVEGASRSRFDALVRHAREHSPLLREHYRGLGPAPRPDEVPVSDRRGLMERFDDWVTDRAVRRRDVDAFLADPSHIGARYLARYVVWQSSGTTGENGIYVQDPLALEVYDALIAVQMSSGRLVPHCVAGMIKGGRAALVAATGDHFASIASWNRACRTMPGFAARSYSITAPTAKLVAQLNAYGPAYLASYPTMLEILGRERSAGRLRVHPSLVWSGGESLVVSARTTLERLWGCPVVNEYGASECMSIAFGCPEGWLHVNADWVVVEPVNANYQPVRAGDPSHTVLVTNLANRVQPIIRYDLGDSVMMLPEPCRCGNPLPAIRVEGRRDDVLDFTAIDGSSVTMAPLALTSVVEDATHLRRFQIVQTQSNHLALRLGIDDPALRAQAFAVARTALTDYLSAQYVARITIELDTRVPEIDAVSGKLRQVIRGSAAETVRRSAARTPRNRISRYSH